MNIYEKLLNIQNELKAPKSQRNSFGNYNYRSCEDILEAVKPLCLKHKVVLTVDDTIIHEGDRYYIEATASLYDTESNKEEVDFIRKTAFAREEETKKGMDASQITGATSSYARKYALNGLFCIDDTKDADTDQFTKQTQEIKDSNITEIESTSLYKLMKDKGLGDDEIQDTLLKKYGVGSVNELLKSQYVEIIKKLGGK